MNNIGLIVAVVFVICVIAGQILSFRRTWKMIKKLEAFFPQVSVLKRRETIISKSILNNENELKKFIANPPSIDSVKERIEEELDPNDFPRSHY